MTRDSSPHAAASELDSPSAAAAAIQSPRPQPVRWLPPPPISLVAAAARELSPASSDLELEKDETATATATATAITTTTAETGSCSTITRGRATTTSHPAPPSPAHVESARELQRDTLTATASEAELLDSGSETETETETATIASDYGTFSSVEDLMKQSMALRHNFEVRYCTPTSTTTSSSSTAAVHRRSEAPRIDFSKRPASHRAPSFSPASTIPASLPTPVETPLHTPRRPATPFSAPAHPAAPFGGVKEEMTPAPSPASSLLSSPDASDGEVEVELELSVGRLGLGKKGARGGNSPVNERVDEFDDRKVDAEGEMDDDVDGERAYELSAEDLAILEQAAAILRRQVKHFEEEITANINQQVKTLYQYSADPPDIADMDSLPDFHIRNNPHAPSAIVKTVQVCCAVERGLASVLEVQRGRQASTEKNDSANSGTKEESLMEVCVKRPIVTGRAMDSAVKSIARTMGYGGREKRGSSIEWRK